MSERFRELRERAGLTREEAAARMDVSPFHIETTDDDFTISYSPADVRRFCEVLDARPSELFGVATPDLPVTAEELVSRIHAECRKRSVTLEQFEDAVGWRLSQCMDPPGRLLEDMTLDGLQWLCRELGINWHRVILGL
jgi:transcriptional regulator with XRE-family HTH domain